jgi:predicted DNA-binding transcriptional regulator AlpA
LVNGAPEFRACVELWITWMKTAKDVIEQSKAIRSLLEGRDTAPAISKPRRGSAAAEYCSAETVAARLDCSKTTVHHYVRRGLLPRPIRIGDLVRWKWTDVADRIESFATGAESHADHEDPYLQGLERGATEEAGY